MRIIEQSQQKDRKLQKRKIWKGQKGFTLAELLIAVAIMAILAAFGFVAVIQYQKSLKLTEMDSSAQEIFIAAQNHMTAAKASGEWDAYLSLSDSEKAKLGTEILVEPSDYTGSDFEDKDAHAFYYVNYSSKSGQTSMDLTNSILSAMLPFGAIDDTLRSGGSYVIEYDLKTASVYGVFYTDSKYGMSYSDVTALDKLEARSDSTNAKKARKTHQNSEGKNVIIGYYGGATAKNLTEKKLDVKDSDLVIENGDKLTVTIKDRNYTNKEKTTVTVKITGEESKAAKTVLLETGDTKNFWYSVADNKEENKVAGKVYTLTLDDITAKNLHFADNFKDTDETGEENAAFIPGENLVIKVTYGSSTALCKMETLDGYTNSLFHTGITKQDAGGKVEKMDVTIASIRHLQNLSNAISSLGVKVGTATQTEDLTWSREAADKETVIFGKDTVIYNKENQYIDSELKASQGKFLSISNTDLVKYHGSNKNISNFHLLDTAVDKKSYVGLFATLGTSETSEGAFEINNLNLDHFTAQTEEGVGAGTLCGAALGKTQLTVTNVKVTNAKVSAGASTGAAGGLVGSMNNGTIDGCAVYLTDTSEKDTAEDKYTDKDKAFTVTGNQAGGLLGSIAANKTVTVANSFAAVPIAASGDDANAGGLIGKVSGSGTALLTNNYSGGYTTGKEYSTIAYNVTSISGNAGGLIGSITNTAATVQNSYSTCSVSGKNTSGGLIGEDSNTGSNYTNCYAVGLVDTSQAEKTSCGTFAGTLAASNENLTGGNFLHTNYYLSNLNGTLGAVSNAAKPGITARTYQELGALTEAAFTETNTGDGAYEKPQTLTTTADHQTVHYDGAWINLPDAEKAYPFPTVNKTAADTAQRTGVQVGDWQESIDDVTELAYYEIYKDKSGKYTIGLYNNAGSGACPLGLDSLVDDPDGAGLDIVQDGYVVLTSILQNAPLQVLGQDTHTVSQLSGISNLQPAIVDGKSGTAPTWDNGSNPIKKDSTVSFGGKTYYLQFMDLLSVNASADSQYSHFAANGTYFLANLHYAKSAIRNQGSQETNTVNDGLPVVTTGYVADKNQATPYEIRTERQYSMMTQDLKASSFQQFRYSYYAQTVDLDYGKTYSYVSQYFGKATATSMNGNGVAVQYPAAAAAQNMNAETPKQEQPGFSGTYDGNNHSINNLTITGTEGYSAGLFGNTQGALIKNLILNQITVNGTDYVGSLIGSSTSYVSANAAEANHTGSNSFFTKVEKITVTDATVSGKTNVGGLLGASLSTSASKVTMNTMNVSGETLVGGVAGCIKNYGTIIASQNNGISFYGIHMSGKNQITSTGTTDTNKTSKEVGVGGFAGFIESTDGNAGNQIPFSFTDNTLESITMTVSTTGNQSAESAALWAGTICFNQGNDVHYTNCNVNDSTLNANALDASQEFEKVNYGSLYGYATANQNGEGTANPITLNTGVSFKGSKIKESKSTTLKCNMGQMIGMVDGMNLKFSGDFEETVLPNINSTQSTDESIFAFGKYIGLLKDSAITNGTIFNKKISYNENGTTNNTYNIMAVHYGGFVGLLRNSTIGNVTVNQPISLKHQRNNNGSIGGLFGTVDESSSVSDIRVYNDVTLSGSVGAEGGIIGTLLGQAWDLYLEPSNGGSITVNMTDGNNTTTYSGGLVGKVTGGSSDLRTSKVSRVIVQGDTNNEKSSYTGGLAGAVMDGGTSKSNVTNCTADNSIVQNGFNVGGAFGKIESASVTYCDVRLSDIAEDQSISITGNYKVTGSGNSGGFVGHIKNATVSNCFAAIPVSASGSNASSTGGFVGQITGNTTQLYNNYASGDVTGQTAETAVSGSTVGGFVGMIASNATGNKIDDCYATGDVAGGTVIGGFLGSLGSSAYVNNCYSLGTVDQTVDLHGGFVGKGGDKFAQISTQEDVENAKLLYKTMKLDIEEEYRNALKKDPNSKETQIYKLCLLGCIERYKGTPYSLEKVTEELISELKTDYLKGGIISIYNMTGIITTKTLDSGAESEIVNNKEPSLSSMLSLLASLQSEPAISLTNMRTWTFKIAADGSSNLYTTAQSVSHAGTINGYHYTFKDDQVTAEPVDIVFAQKRNPAYGTYVTATSTTSRVDSNNEKFTGCVYLSDSSYLYNQSETWADKDNKVVQPMTFAEMQSRAADSYLTDLNTDIKGSQSTRVDRFNWAAADGTTTHRYEKALPTVYPFPALSAQVGSKLSDGDTTTGANSHWGDWPEMPEPVADDVGLLYYEIVDGKLYYHGYTSNFESNPKDAKYTEVMTKGTNLDDGLVTGAGKYVTEDGYLVLLANEFSATSQDCNVDIRFANEGVSQASGYLEKVTDAKIANAFKGYTPYYLNDKAINHGVFTNQGQENTITLGQAEYSTFKTRTTFVVDPLFGDSVIDSSTPRSSGVTFAVRSARQLLQVGEYSNKGKVGYRFEQQLDIDMNQTFTNQNQSVSYEYTTPISRMDSVTYIADTYKDGAISKGYSISGLKSYLFQTIGRSSVIKNVTILDLNLSEASNYNKVGFAETVEEEAQIIGCSIHAEKIDTNGYAAVKIGKEGTWETSGFVDTNRGTIKECYVTGKISGKNVYGFAKYNQGTIENCYSNGIAEAAVNAVGFVGTNNSGGTVKKSYALVSLSASGKNNGQAYGFVQKNDGSIKDSYAAMQKLQAKTIYQFGAGQNKSGNSYYMIESELQGKIAAETVGTGITYQQLKAKAGENTAIESITNKFGTEINNDSNDVVYPFPFYASTEADITMQFYGDWPKSETTAPQAAAIHTGIAYYENNNAGYEGWYALTDHMSDENSPYCTLTADKGVTLADTDTSYGILITAGETPICEGAELESTPAASVTLDGVDYDYYKLVADDLHAEATITLKTASDEAGTVFTYNDDFAAAIAAEKPLGVAAEEGGRPYQIRTNAQLRSINQNKQGYLDKAYRQTLDVALTGENFDPIGGASSWTEDTYSFLGSYDAGLILEGRTLTDSSTDRASDAIQEGYAITGFTQQLLFTSIDGNGYTSEEEGSNDQYKQLQGGLFASVSGTIRGVNLSGNLSLRTDGSNSYLQGAVGSIAGNVTEQGVITDTNSDVWIQVDIILSNLKLGGLAGANDGIIQNSYYNGSIQDYYYDENTSGQLRLQETAGGTASIGGFAGYNTGTITGSGASAYLLLHVQNPVPAATLLGGFVGWSWEKDSEITNSWSKTVLGNAEGVVGGFAGLISDQEYTTTLVNDYALVRFENIGDSAQKGLFLGSNGTLAIRSCYAAELNGSNYLQSSTCEFQNGKEMKLADYGCFIWNRIDEIPFDTLNVDGVWNLSNSVYPTLTKNSERNTDLIQVSGGIDGAKAVTVTEIPGITGETADSQERVETEKTTETQTTETQTTPASPEIHTTSETQKTPETDEGSKTQDTAKKQSSDSVSDVTGSSLKENES
ncbi:MAG: prepilin-type N-terminal cleavage/methylation domain-containing protein [Lachnospiraceae bacterium]|nr:prepilin-type N-terminal cleavage/methylation domain-containing protein [Lachnospiraceae bacterium]